MPDANLVQPTPPTQSSPLAFPSWLTVTALALLIVVTFTATLGMSPLIEPDEPRYAEIAREMLVLDDWVTPHLNYVKYFEKPPLVYWLTALSMQMFGFSDAVPRLWPVLFGLMVIVCAWALARSIYGPLEGLVAAAILATTPFYFALTQLVILDIPLTAFMSFALTAGWFAYLRPASSRSWVALLYAMTALAVLTKGPVAAVLMAGILILFVVIQRDLAYLRRLLSLWGIALFFLIVAPWFVLVSWRNPEFVDFFVVDQHINRYLRSTEHKQPLLFFVPIVFAGMLPWTLILFSRGRWVAGAVWRMVTLRVAPGTLYCVLWSAVVFGFFSLSGSKLATYVAPLFCPLAVLTSRAVVVFWKERSIAPFYWVASLLTLLAAVAIIGAVATPFVSSHPRAPLVVPYLYGGFVLLAVLAAIMWRQLRSASPSFGRLLASTIVCMLAFQAFVLSGRGVAQHYTPLALAIRDQATADDLIIMYRHYTQGVPFYTGRRAIMVGSWGELDFGSRQGDQSEYFWKDEARLFETWRSGKRVFLVINKAYLDSLRGRFDPAPREIVSHGKKVLLVNFPAS